MSDLETGAISAPTRRLFGGVTTVATTAQVTPISAGAVYDEILPDEAADYADMGGDIQENPSENPIVSDPDSLTGIVEPVASGATAESSVGVESPAMSPLSHLELEQLSIEELRRQQEEIQRALEEKQQAEKQDVINQIVSVVQTYGITTEELVEALGGLKIKRKGVKATMKYRDPVSGAEWSGRGKEPSWIRGQDRDKFLIRN